MDIIRYYKNAVNFKFLKCEKYDAKTSQKRKKNAKCYMKITVGYCTTISKLLAEPIESQSGSRNDASVLATVCSFDLP